jgi:uncharacterized membrane protein
MYLSPAQAQSIERRIATIEARSGVQVLVALIGRCDAYPEIRWKAFALGVALAALAVVGVDLARPAWSAGLIEAVVAILAVGGANALLAQYLPWYGRRFVRHNRAQAEAQDYAEALFLEKSLFATPHRATVLMLLGLFERVVVVHPDAGLAGRVGPDDWRRVVDAVAPRLADGDRQAGIESGLKALEDVLERVPGPGSGLASGGTGNALPDRPIEERGA